MARSIHSGSQVATNEAHVAAPKRGVLYPLDFVCERIGVSAPSARNTPSTSIPTPYQSLLVHEGWMTETLERHFGGPVTLRALFSLTRGQWLFRRSLLVLQYSGRPVEMGTIRVNLKALTPDMRAQVLRRETPIGRILARSSNFQSSPSAFLKITPNPELMGMFWMRESRTLYGRQTVMTLNNRKIGEIIEILPPMDA